MGHNLNILFSWLGEQRFLSVQILTILHLIAPLILNEEKGLHSTLNGLCQHQKSVRSPRSLCAKQHARS